MNKITAKQISSWSIVGMVVASAAISIPNISTWIATPLVLIWLVGIMGILLAINLKIKTENISEYSIYAGGLGFAFLLIGGLTLNWMLPYFGNLHPLGKLPVTLFFDACTILLAARAYIFNKQQLFSFKEIKVNKESIWFGVIPWVFVIASICGAEILNNGGSGWLTMGMIIAIAIYVGFLLAYREKLSGWAYISALYSIGLSLLLMYSMRSGHILGWDINLEYRVFQTTLQNLRWQTSYFPGLDYNACISITILPTILKVLTNAPSEYIFKFIFQIFFAIIPVMVYIFARRYLERPMAFLAGFLFLSQTWFFEQMPALIRQETAFIFSAAILLVAFDERLSKRMRYVLFYIFTTALVLSHYSTAYIWIALLLVVLIFSYVSRFFIKALRKHAIVITPVMVALSFVMVYLWQVPLTHTAGTAKDFASKINTANIAAAVPTTGQLVVTTSTASSTSSTTESSSNEIIKVVAAPVAGPIVAVIEVFKNAFATTAFISQNPNTDQNVLLAEQQAINWATFQTYPAGLSPDYTAVAMAESRPVGQEFPHALSLIVDVLAWISKFLMIDIFPVIGIFGLYRILRRDSSASNYDFILISVAAFGLLVITILVPYIQVYYNFTRLYLQMFLILSTLAILGGVMASRYFPRYQMLILGGMVILLFGDLTGGLAQLTGGESRVTFNQPPGNLDAYYMYDGEVASAQWLSKNNDNTSPIQADVIANLRLESFGNLDADNNFIFPRTIDPASYVYTTKENIGGEGFYQYNNNLLVYNYPIDFINNQKSLIYNDGDSRIYK